MKDLKWTPLLLGLTFELFYAYMLIATTMDGTPWPKAVDLFIAIPLAMFFVLWNMFSTKTNVIYFGYLCYKSLHMIGMIISDMTSTVYSASRDIFYVNFDFAIMAYICVCFWIAIVRFIYTIKYDIAQASGDVEAEQNYQFLLNDYNPLYIFKK